MNSVKGISKIISKAGLTPENCRIICSDNRTNRSNLPEGFTISTVNDPVKTINFYTSTAFEGCDIFDEKGRTFIICDPHRSNTLLDISTSMLQICGRLRNSIYKGELTLIYDTTRYEDAETLDDYMAKIEEETENAKKDVEGLNQCTPQFRKKIASLLKDYDAPFIRLENDKLTVDQNMINLDIVNYKIIHGNYRTQVNLDAELTENGFDLGKNYYADASYVELMSTNRMSFKDCCETYAENKQEQGIFFIGENEKLIRLKALCPEACEAVDKLGIEEIRKMKYHKSNIRRKLTSLCGEAQEIKIKKELDRRLQKFIPYTIPQIKKTLGEIYADVHLNKKPMATDLNKWYRTRLTKKDGQDAYVIEGDRMIVY